jgi:hypothetical protein
LAILLVLAVQQPCFAKKPLQVPAPLAPWVDWVLYDQEEQLQCIPHYNEPGRLECNWPTELSIDLHDEGGSFSQTWHVHHESWVSLPGNNQQWPQEVKVDGTPRVLVEKDDAPRLQLQPGTHMVTGSFAWPRLPEYLQVPPRSALINLSVNSKSVDFPHIDAKGRLWLKIIQKEEKIEDRLQIESFRYIDDSIPPQVEVYVTLDVAGSAREITLGPIYNPEQFIPLALRSSLPAKLEADARMRVQVRPGRHSFTLTVRHVGPLQTLTFTPPADGFWPPREIWSFAARTNLRVVEIEGVPSVDPLQTSMPQEWRQYPAYRLQAGDIMGFKEVKRGDPQPPPDQLTLNRRLWLRFDGSGYTIQDQIGGRKNTNWRLEMDPAIALGRVAVDGAEQLITRRQGAEVAGVELRKGLINLTADSIYQGNIAALPATGWQHDFQQMQGVLSLPPGWKLLNASGIDNIPNTWIKRWTLLDFFIVLIFSIAVAKLFSKPLAGMAFITLVLIYHEPGAPRYVWLALLAGFALLKHLPVGKFKQAVKVYQLLVFLVLVVTAIPYSIQALRVGIYPQLARPWASMNEYASRQQFAPAPMQMDAEEVLPERSVTKQAADIVHDLEKKAGAPFESMKSGGRSAYYRSQVMQYDPKALTQTGPGLPQWQPFETIPFSWSGPVTSDQRISFTLIGPKTNLVLSFIRVLLIILLALGMFGIGYRRGKGLQLPDLKSLVMFPLLVFVLLSPCTGQANEIPSPEMLHELQKRLLEKDACFPDCAVINESTVMIRPATLAIVVQADTRIDTAIPLPAHVDHWLPQKVMVDGSHAQGLLRADNKVWILVPAGKHTVKLTGAIRKQNTVQLPFPLKPHHLTVKATGWSVEGLHPDGTFDAQLQFKRIVEQESRQTEILETGVLPPFASVERIILLGLTWKVETRVRRRSPTGSAMVLHVPLLPGESVITEGVPVDKGMAQVTLQAGQTSAKWESFLEMSDAIVLNHPETDDWTEIWKVDVSPIFHLEYDGIPVILHQTGERWYPTWHPWPGEEVRLRISRPLGVDGQTMTVEKSRLELRPGQRTTDARLFLSIKSSQGGQHAIGLPADAELQEVKINGTIQPIRQEGQNVPLPITPGQQDIELQWREAGGISTRYRTSAVDLNTESVNASVDVYLPRNRWPLFMGGEQLVGPAVLFWSVLIVVVLVAFGLSRTGLTPLRFYHWLLLGIGMSMSNLAACFIVVGWLIGLDLRKKGATLDKGVFNGVQIGIGMLTVFALGALLFAISQGLLGHPDMNIVGNGSGTGLLRWYQDVSDRTLPQAWVFSIPMLAYRLAMLAWALWISFWLVGVVKWGWQQFTEPTIWYSSPPKPKDPSAIHPASGSDKEHQDK